MLQAIREAIHQTYPYSFVFTIFVYATSIGIIHFFRPRVPIIEPRLWRYVVLVLMFLAMAMYFCVITYDGVADERIAIIVWMAVALHFYRNWSRADKNWRAYRASREVG